MENANRSKAEGRKSRIWFYLLPFSDLYSSINIEYLIILLINHILGYIQGHSQCKNKLIKSKACNTKKSTCKKRRQNSMSLQTLVHIVGTTMVKHWHSKMIKAFFFVLEPNHGCRTVGSIVGTATFISMVFGPMIKN